jgi:rod shape-determining protein MreD
MRWLTFFILLYFMTALQNSRFGGIPQASDSGDIWPFIEYLPLLAVFYALYASEAAAPLAALICGLVYDLFKMEFIGTSLIPLALVGLLIVRIRLSIFREHFISQVVITLLGVLTFALLSVILRRLLGAPMQGHSMWAQFSVHAGNALYTAIVAPFVFYLLFRFHHLLGFTSHGTRGRAHS